MGKEQNMLKQVARVLAMVSVLAPAVSFAASDSANRMTITSINIYLNYPGYSPGTFVAGALVFFTPAKPGMGNCLDTAGNVVWISTDADALFRAVYDSYRAGTTIGFETSGCTGDGYYPVVSRISF
jgi:hypothetical protein